jgi:hypothetical protein
MEATVNGSGSKGIFAIAVNTNDGMVAVASTATAQLTMTTAIAAATIGHRRHVNAIASSSLHPTVAFVHNDCCQQRSPLLQLPSTAASIDDDCHCHCQ